MENIEDAANRKRKIRIIATTCILAVAILGIGAMVIISMITRIGNGKTTNTNATQTTVAASNEQKTEDAQKVEETKPADNTKTSSVSTAKKSEAVEISTNKTASEDDIPSTGPADFIPTALMIGVAVYLVGINLNLQKSPRNY